MIPDYRICVLGDSRVFDTYYAQAVYGSTAYGYQATFPHVLGRLLAKRSTPVGAAYDCIHIPDHFRGRTIQNNILRLALTDPDCVVLCDGIWESLISKRHLIEHVERTLAETSASADVHVDLSPGAVIDLYREGKLSLSPAIYSTRIRRIASWFIRRRRRVIWLTTPIPPKGHRGGVHFAGNYRPFEGWHDCLTILNREAEAAITHCGGEVLDLAALMQRSGGAESCLIDQWHFSSAFHDTIARALSEVIESNPRSLPADHVSRSLMVQGPQSDLGIFLIGTDRDRSQYCGAPHGLTCRGRADSADMADIPEGTEAVLIASSRNPDADAIAVLRRHPHVAAVLFSDDLLSLDNPPVDDRSQFGTLK